MYYYYHMTLTHMVNCPGGLWARYWTTYGTAYKNWPCVMTVSSQFSMDNMVFGQPIIQLAYVMTFSCQFPKGIPTQAHKYMQLAAEYGLHFFRCFLFQAEWLL